MQHISTDNYWIDPRALSIGLNAGGIGSDVDPTMLNNTTVRVFSDDASLSDVIGYDVKGNYREWKVSAEPTRLSGTGVRYLYLAIPRSESVGVMALMMWPAEEIDVNGKNAAGVQVGPTDYIYLYLRGVLSAPDGTTQLRKWTSTPQSGTLGTPKATVQRMAAMVTKSQMTDIGINVQTKTIDMTGSFSGFVYNKKMSITPANIAQYATLDEESGIWVLNLKKLDNWIEISGFEENIKIFLVGSRQDADTARALVGNELYIYNRNMSKAVLITGDTYMGADDTVGHSCSLGINHVCLTQCKMRFLDNTEDIYWQWQVGTAV